jgi:hypothetical protein
MRTLLLTLVLLLAMAAPAAAQDAVDQAVQALQDDAVYVDPDAEQAISESEADALRRQIDGEGVPVEIAILPADAGDAEEIASRLREETGQSAAVVVGNSFRVDGSPEIEDAATAAFEASSDEGVAAVLLDFVDRAAGGGGAEGDEEEGGFGAGAIVLLGALGAGGAVIAVSHRRRRREQAAEFAEVKENARDDLVALGEDIRALELDMEMPDVSPEAKADYETAVTAYGRADQSWRLAQRPDDLEPAGSALEEGRWAMTSARARIEGRPPPERRSPCFFDPRHGPSDREVEWAPDNGAPRMVPACEADAQRVERGEDPEAREVTVGGERMPYWAAGPMYAPFMGGFYGAGIFPGLMMGTMMGSMWDEPSGGSGGGDFGGGDFGGGDFGGGFGGGDF